MVCMEANASHLVVPCGHQCVCEGCSAKLSFCPVCRARMKSIIRVFAVGTPPPALGMEQQRSRQMEEKRRKIQKRMRRRQKRDLANQVLDVIAQKTVLDDPRSDDAALMVAIISLEQLGDLPEDVLRRTLVGRSLNSVWRRSSGTDVGNRALALLETWKGAFRRARASSSTSPRPELAEVEELQQEARTDVSVVAVKYSTRARLRLARQATAARKDSLSRPLVVEECIDVEDADSPSPASENPPDSPDNGEAPSDDVDSPAGETTGPL